MGGDFVQELCKISLPLFLLALLGASISWKISPWRVVEMEVAEVLVSPGAPKCL